MKAKILYVEDDESLNFVTRDNLELQGYEMFCATDGREARNLIRQDTYDLCIIDVMLPEVDGFTLASEIRQRDPQVPIIFLTAKSLKEDRLHGLRIGADDYMTKPFSIEELILKIEVFLRRSNYRQTPPTPQKIEIGRYELDPENMTLSGPASSRKLTQRESDLLLLLAQHKNQLLKRSQILEQIWGQDDYFLGRSLDVFLSRLRKYLREDERIKIENVHGVGFRLLEN